MSNNSNNHNTLAAVTNNINVITEITPKIIHDINVKNTTSATSTAAKKNVISRCYHVILC